MYFYLYDVSLAEPKYSNVLAKIETHLTDLELQGRVGRLGPLKSAKEMVKSALKTGATTIVAVGNDQTVAEAINAVAASDATIGVIPIGKPNIIAKLLGIPEGEEACEVLAARKTEVVDLGKVHDYYFLTSAEVDAARVVVECDDRYTLEPEADLDHVQIINLSPESRCQDGFLEARIESRSEGWFRRPVTRPSVIPFRRAKISTMSEEGTINIEHAFTLKLPVVIEVVPSILKIIVGRDRVF